MKNRSDIPVAEPSEPPATDLPEGWVMATVRELTKNVQPGFACGQKDVVGGVRHLRMNNIGIDCRLDLALVRTVPPEVANSKYDLIMGDVLVCTTNSGKLVGKCALFDAEGRFSFSNHLTRLRPVTSVADSQFLAWSIWSQWLSGAFVESCRNWVNQSTLPKDALLDTDIPLPPLAEQKRIVAKVDELLARVNAARERLAKVPALLKRFRQSVLAAACSGRLTEKWRRAEGPIDWEEKSLGEMAKLVTSGSRGWAKHYADAGPIFIRAQNVSSDQLDLSDVAHVDLPGKGEGSRTLVSIHDILVTITGANVTKTALVSEEIGEAYVNQHVALVRLYANEYAPYVWLWLVSPEHGRSQLLDAAYGAGKPGLNLTQIRDVRVLLPPFPEQQEISHRVEFLFALADSIEKQVAAGMVWVEKLTQAILAKAFRGELVPQNPEDEPAVGTRLSCER